MAVAAASVRLERLPGSTDENDLAHNSFINGALHSIETLLMGTKGSNAVHNGKRVQTDENKGTQKKGRPALVDVSNAVTTSKNSEPDEKVQQKSNPATVVTDHATPTTVMQAANAPATTNSQNSQPQAQPLPQAPPQPPAQPQPPSAPAGALETPPEIHDRVVDIDAKLACWPCACSTYAQDIFRHLRQAELMESRRPNPRYMEEVQNDITVSMRSILIDWLVEVAEEYKMQTDTLFLTVNYLDRFLSLRRITREILQLVGVTCMWVAAKYEEIYPPNVHEFCHITDNSYTKQDILYMEREILSALSYDLTVATSKTFLRRFLQAADADQQLHFLAGYILELALLDYDLVGFPPSMVAAAAVYVALVSLKRVPWTATLEHYSRFKPRDFSVVAFMLARTHTRCFDHPELKGIRSKYASSRFLHTAVRITPVPTSVLKYYLS